MLLVLFLLSSHFDSHCCGCCLYFPFVGVVVVVIIVDVASVVAVVSSLDTVEFGVLLLSTFHYPYLQFFLLLL